MKREIGETYGEQYARLAELLNEARGWAKATLPTYQDRKQFFEWIVNGEPDPIELLRQGDEQAVRDLIAAASPANRDTGIARALTPRRRRPRADGRRRRQAGDRPARGGERGRADVAGDRRAVRDGDAPKGDVLGTARIAGIQAAKRTAELIPLCHPSRCRSSTSGSRSSDTGVVRHRGRGAHDRRRQESRWRR